MDLFDLFERGGPLMWAILACSIVGVVFFVERLFALGRSRILPLDTFRSLTKHLEAGDIARAEQLCRENQSMLSRIAESGLKHREQGRAVAKEAMEESGQVEVGRLESGVGVVSTVAAISPLLGLLGTVAGMIQVFRDVAATDNPDIGVLAGGIWQALITTGAGLTIAIPFYVAYRYLETRINRYGRELEEASLALLDHMTSAPRTAPAPTPVKPSPPEGDEDAASTDEAA